MGARMKNNKLQAELLRSFDLKDQGSNRFLMKITGCPEVDQVTRVREYRVNTCSIFHRMKLLTIFIGDCASFPLAGIARENLESVAADRFGALHGAVQPALDRHVSAEQRW